MHTSIENPLPGLKRKHSIGQGFAQNVGKYFKKKAKGFIREQYKDIARDIVNNDATLTGALKNKISKVKRTIKLAGAGKTVGRGKRRKRGRPKTKRRVKKKRVKRRKVRKVGRKKRRSTGKKRACYKGTIFGK